LGRVADPRRHSLRRRAVVARLLALRPGAGAIARTGMPRSDGDADL
jgi:hypothetical protein